MIIFRYLAREVFFITIAAATALFVIFISNQFIHYLYYAVDGRLSASLAMQLLLFKTPALIGSLLPLSLFLAILLAYGRMYADNEMTILFSSGISKLQLFKFTMTFTSVIVIITAVLMLWVAPPFNKHLENLFSKGAASPIELIAPGHFQSVDHGRWIFYTKEVSNDRDTLYNVFVTEQQATTDGSSKTGLLVANKAYQKRDKQTGDSFIVFDHGNRYIGAPGQKDYQILKFDQYWVKMNRNNTPTDYNEHSIATSALWHKRDNNSVAEIQWRLSMPIMAIILAMMAIPLSRVKTRKGRYAQLIPAILLYVIYSNFVMLSRGWIRDGTVSHVVGMWWIHAIMLLTAILLNLKEKISQKLRKTFMS